MKRRTQLQARQTVFWLLVTFVALTISFIGFTHYRSIISRAASIFTPSVHGTPGDLWSDTVLGKIDFNQSGANEVTSFKVSNPGGVIVDRNVHPNTIFVYDGGN